MQARRILAVASVSPKNSLACQSLKNSHRVPFWYVMSANTSALASAASQATTQQGFSVAVAKKAIDNTKIEGQMALGLIQNAAPPPPTATRGNVVNTYA